jgi:hypothetical protein
MIKVARLFTKKNRFILKLQTISELVYGERSFLIYKNIRNEVYFNFQPSKNK